MAKTKSKASVEMVLIKLATDSIINQTFANSQYYRAKALEDILKSKLDIHFTEEDITNVIKKNTEKYAAALEQEYNGILEDGDFITGNLKKFWESAAEMAADFEKH